MPCCYIAGAVCPEHQRKAHISVFNYKHRFRELKGCITKNVTKPTCLCNSWFSTLAGSVCILLHVGVFYIYFCKYSTLRSVLVMVFYVAK